MNAMLEQLTRLAARVRDRLFGGTEPPEPPWDPYSSVREPRRKGPGGRSSAVGVREPEPERLVAATGHTRNSR